MRRANELTASLAEQTQKHKAELASWMKRLIECETIKSSQIECRVKFDADCVRLRDQLKTVKEQLAMSRTRAKAAKLTVQLLEEQSTGSLRLRVEKCLCNYVKWKIQTLKWTKLDSLERRLK